MTAVAPVADPITLAAQADVLLALAATLGEVDAQRLGRAQARCAAADALAVRAGLPAAREALLALGEALAGTTLPEWLVERERLFSCGVACPPNETGFVRRDKGAILGDVCAFYRAFGVALEEGKGEKADHIVAELELMALLLVMLARAERPEDAAVTHAALRAFAEDHLGAWLPAFALRLGDVTALPLGRAIAQALLSVWAALALAHDLPAARPLPLAEETGTPFECGMAETHETELA